jgi:hypothetical protein
MYFVDFVAVSLVSWIFKIAVSLRELLSRLCKFGKAVLSVEAFQVTILVSWFVVMLILSVGVGVSGSGGGCVYSVIFSKQRSDYNINVFGRNGNFL